MTLDFDSQLRIIRKSIKNTEGFTINKDCQNHILCVFRSIRAVPAISSHLSIKSVFYVFNLNDQTKWECVPAPQVLQKFMELNPEIKVDVLDLITISSEKNA